ncbi:hypothetical protein A3860_21560 [Niastella vici]|uniref:DUF2249 domain-containing protein n=1 Tax=Niastella vici TaxID=1703345 RepID=A0A1V9G0A5_9BACT|nr:DUF2249 domain-containing protein [Niastella vici]OQP64010.1 hypothetical protein A3860_21560 [Niastella vici]
MVITANTKIAAILKHNPAALEAIVSISPKFEKLRNPVLRKLMAGRASLSMASKISGCRLHELFEKLQPLGFVVDETVPAFAEEKREAPDFIRSIQKEQIVVLDVRPVMASGKDPLNIILEKIRALQPKQVLKIQNTFEPTPLMKLLQKQGFESYATAINNNLVETWFYGRSATAPPNNTPLTDATKNWNQLFERFKDRLQTIDVRNLEMPLPMLTILEALDNLAAGTALFVYHKRIPVLLLPELVQRKFDYRIKEISDREVHLLIFNS